MDVDGELLKSAAAATLFKLQEQLEMGCLHMQRKHCAIQTRASELVLSSYSYFCPTYVLFCVILASSKQRSSLRWTITNKRKKILRH